MSDTEKVSMNLSVVDLGQVDLLVDQGFYSSRTDFLRTAVRNLLLTHSATVQQTVARQSMVLGVLVYTRRDLEERLAAEEQVEITAVGVAIITDDVAPELARATIRSIKVFGVLRASPGVKAALADRIH